MVQVCIDYKDSLSVIARTLWMYRNFLILSDKGRDVIYSHLQALDTFFIDHTKNSPFAREGRYYIKQFKEELKEEHPNITFLKLFYKGIKNCIFTLY